MTLDNGERDLKQKMLASIYNNNIKVYYKYIYIIFIYFQLLYYNQLYINHTSSSIIDITIDIYIYI